ncbi:hypothetical protein TCAL_17267 [Tigriopus californicus]|uniref:Uncharacterized protein n=1 Tax=Tigriopus californicus TaxID=6832 RepID=A0A553NZI4_TIGCA|nr:hypothetical protein TCAL_17267 [Tigriopus californicus]
MLLEIRERERVVLVASLDREKANLDREKSSLDRERATLIAFLDRERATLDREKANLDREKASLDRERATVVASLDRERATIVAALDHERVALDQEKENHADGQTKAGIARALGIHVSSVRKGWKCYQDRRTTDMVKQTSRPISEARKSMKDAVEATIAENLNRSIRGMGREFHVPRMTMSRVLREDLKLKSLDVVHWDGQE